MTGQLFILQNLPDYDFFRSLICIIFTVNQHIKETVYIPVTLSHQRSEHFV